MDWSIHDFDTYSDEAQLVIAIITGGHPPGKPKEEDGHADK